MVISFHFSKLFPILYKSDLVDTLSVSVLWVFTFIDNIYTYVILMQHLLTTEDREAIDKQKQTSQSPMCQIQRILLLWEIAISSSSSSL